MVPVRPERTAGGEDAHRAPSERALDRLAAKGHFIDRVHDRAMRLEIQMPGVDRPAQAKVAHRHTGEGVVACPGEDLTEQIGEVSRPGGGHPSGEHVAHTVGDDVSILDPQRRFQRKPRPEKGIAPQHDVRVR